MRGAIAGDIIGSIYERRNIKTTEFPLFQPTCHFTDDTVLTVALADSILRLSPRHAAGRDSQDLRVPGFLPRERAPGPSRVLGVDRLRGRRAEGDLDRR
jgi:hypothetical protein